MGLLKIQNRILRAVPSLTKRWAGYQILLVPKGPSPITLM